MRAELPWNVAGIPPEAREAARAAARREGLSVGEWLTRRILRSFSGMEEEFQAPPQGMGQGMGAGLNPGLGAPLDSWGLPQSSASRRDTEDMLARVSRTEHESSDAYRRIEEHLRTVGRRLDSAERSQSENNRVISKTATEINIATREQSQAFDQLGNHVMAMADRIERLERSAAQDGVKDAVKALHQGLSRLADQITQTANQSATQIASLSGNLEQVAGRLGQVREQAEEADKALEQRLVAAEKANQHTTNALDHALEKLDAQANIRAGDLADAQKQQTQTEVTIMRLEENLSRLEQRSHDPAIDRRLDGIDRALNDIAQRIERNPAEALEDQMRALHRRLEALDKKHNDMLAEVRANLVAPTPAPPAFEPESSFTQPQYAPPPGYEPQPTAFEAPPFAEPPAGIAPPAFGPEGYDPSAFPPGFNAADPYAGGFAPDNFAAPAFGQPDFEAPPAEGPPENFLSAARRSAQAAHADTARGRTFAWGASGTAKARPRYLIPAIIAFVLLVALAAGLVLNQKMKAVSPAPKPVAQSTEPGNGGDQQGSNEPATNTDTTVTLAPPENGFTPAPQAGATTGPKRTVLPLAEQPVRSAPVKPVPGEATQSSATSPSAGDRIAQLANAGNPIAETILGLKYLDGQGVPVDVAQAGKWLEKAANAGQPVAQYRLGTMYERGQGTTADPAKASKWYMAAANQGNRKAMHNLAVAYADGAMGKKDMAEAARWFSKAAALGLSDSQFNLAVLYERGDGVPQSLIDAFKWYAIASAAGDTESKQRLSVLQTQLSDTDRAAAQKSASSFHAAALGRAANVPPDVSDLPAQ